MYRTPNPSAQETALKKHRALTASALRHGISADVLSDRTTSDCLDAAFAVHAALGYGHAAATYKEALRVELRARGRAVHSNATFSVVYRSEIVGNFEADLLVDDRVLIRVAADQALLPEHKSDTVRGLSAGGVKIGLAINFGLAELFFARLL